MYQDPKYIRKHRHMLSLNDEEQALAETIAGYKGEAVATVLRQLAIVRAAEILAAKSGASVTRPAA